MWYLLDKFMEWLGYERAKGAVTIRTRYVKRTPAKPTSDEPIANQPFLYFMGDALTPNLSKTVQPINLSTPRYNVRNYQGGGYAPGTVQNQAANVHFTIANAIEFVNRQAGIAGNSLTKWAGSPNLVVMPRAGMNVNAFYNRASLQFFYFKNNGNRTVYAADAPDIVAHELGHAILDSFQPKTYSAASLEVASFHEAFGDIMAFLTALTHDEVIAHALAENGGDFMKPSIVTRLAEDFGSSIFDLSRGGSGHKDCLRSMLNNFKYVSPSTLPKDAPPDKLAAECHSFGQIYAAVVYEIMVKIYDQTRSECYSPENSIKHARDVVGQYILRAVQHAPVNSRYYESISKTLLWADKTTHNRYYDLMREVLLSRNLITEEVRILSAPTCENDDLIVKVKSHAKVTLSDHFVRAQSQEDNDLYDAELELPVEEAYLYDQDKQLLDVLSVSEEDSLAAAQEFIDYLHSAKLVDDTPSTPFEVTDGKLVRTHFECGCGNGCGPSKFSPEFYKKQKPENHTGCCGGCGKATVSTPKKTVKRGCFIRYKS